MSKRFQRASSAFVIGAALFLTEAFAAGGGLTISVGEVTGTPNGGVAVPLLMNTGATPIDVGAIEVSASYKPGAIAFTGVKKGFLIEGVGGDMDSKETKDSAKNGMSAISVKATARGNPPKALPSGLIFTFLFHVAADAKPGTKVALKIDKAVVKDMNSPPLEFLVVVEKSGGVQVITEDEVPVTPCFFFSH